MYSVDVMSFRTGVKRNRGAEVVPGGPLLESIVCALGCGAASTLVIDEPVLMHGYTTPGRTSAHSSG